MTEKKKKPGRPRKTSEELLVKQLQVVTDLDKLKKVPSDKRTAAQLKKIAVLDSYARRITRRLETGKW